VLLLLFFIIIKRDLIIIVALSQRLLGHITSKSKTSCAAVGQNYIIIIM